MSIDNSNYSCGLVVHEHRLLCDETEVVPDGAEQQQTSADDEPSPGPLANDQVEPVNNNNKQY